MAGLGPMAGQANHFHGYAPEKIPYAIERYINETRRLYGVMNKRLADRAYLAGEYSIADIASWPWIVGHARLELTLEEFPHLKRWFELVGARPAVAKGFAVGQELRSPTPTMDDEAKKWLFGQKPKA